MRLDHEDPLMQPMLARFRDQVGKVADAMEEAAKEVRRRLEALPEDADYDKLFDLATEVLRIHDRSHDAVRLDHNVFGSLQDIHKAHFALDDMKAKAEEERQRLATPPVDHWDYLQRLSDERNYLPCRIRQGSRWHTGSLMGMRVRDATRAAKSQYANIFEHNFDTLQVKVGNRYVPFAEAYPLEEWTPPSETA